MRVAASSREGGRRRLPRAKRVYDARCAFENALEWDPSVHFEQDLATDAVMGAFAEARGHVCGAGSTGTSTKPNPRSAGER
jgi:hypothetical protein